MLENGLEKSGELELIQVAKSLSDEKKRGCLLRVIQRYHEMYYFEVLDYPISYLSGQLGSCVSNDQMDRETALSHVHEGKFEYCFSLNFVAESLERLMAPDLLSIEDFTTCVDLILRAYSCNEPEEQFLDREIFEIKKIVGEEK